MVDRKKHRVIKEWGTMKEQGFREELILLVTCVQFFNAN